jgi:preprotein translocase subunit SecD
MAYGKEGNKIGIDMLQYWRIWLLVIMILGAVFAIGLKSYPYGRNGVEIVYVSDDSPANGILEQGMIITDINGVVVRGASDWNEKVKDLTGPVSLTANGEEYSFYVNDTLGIDAMDMERLNLELGLDLRGGTRIILKPKENATKDVVDQVIATLETRANLYGLKEMRFYGIGSGDTYYIQIEAAGVGSDIVNDLLSKQGRFEAKVLKPVDLTGNTSTIRLGSESYPVSVLGENVRVNNTVIEPNGTFTLKGIEFQYMNKTGGRLLFLASVYGGKDIELVYTDPQRSGLMPIEGGYNFYFVVLVSQKGAERFADVTTGIPSYLDLQTGEEFLDSRIYLYLDEQVVSDLRIGSELGGKVYQSPQIQGSRADKDEAIAEKLRLQTILRSGALPTTLETASIDVISPTLGLGFFQAAGYAVLLAGIIVVVIVFIRYRSLKIALPLVFIGMSEVVIILGIAAKGDSMIWLMVLLLNFFIITTAWWKKHGIDIYAWVGALLIPLLGMLSWTIDLAAIGGIIAAIGTGVDHQIIIADEAVSGRGERIYTLKDKIKRAFFIIFGAAATTIAAMIPLMFLGIGLVRGFAITTMVGVLVGILVTRPAYARIIEMMVKR